MRKKHVASLLLVFCTLGLVRADAAAPTETQPTLTLTITPVKAAYRVGESGEFEIRIDNVGTQAVLLPADIKARIVRHVTTPSGKHPIWPEAFPEAFEKQGRTILLEPGCFCGTRKSAGYLQEVGLYQVSVIYLGPESQSIPGMWAGRIPSQVIQLRVVK